MFFQKSILSAVLLASVSFSVFPMGDIERVAMIIAASPMINRVSTIDRIVKNPNLKVQDSSLVEDVLKDLAGNYLELSEKDIVTLINFVQELRDIVFAQKDDEVRVSVLRFEGSASRDISKLIQLIKYWARAEGVGGIVFDEYAHEDANYFVASSSEEGISVGWQADKAYTVKVVKPTEDMRLSIVEGVVDYYKKTIDKKLVRTIVDCTEELDAIEVSHLVKLMVNFDALRSINRKSCLIILDNALDILNGNLSLIANLKKVDFLVEKAITEAELQRYGGKVFLNQIFLDEGMRKSIDKIIKKRKDFNLDSVTKPVYLMVIQGPPGVVKTELARAFACELEWRYVKVLGGKIMKPLANQSAIDIGETFDDAMDSDSGVVIHIDEADMIAVPEVKTSTDLIFAGTSSVLWEKSDECRLSGSKVLIILTCNNYERLPEPLKSRIQADFKISLPDQNACEHIIQLKLAAYGMIVSPEIIQKLAKKAVKTKFSGRDLTESINRAIDESEDAGNKTALDEFLRESFAERVVMVGNRSGDDSQEEAQGWWNTFDVWSNRVLTVLRLKNEYQSLTESKKPSTEDPKKKVLTTNL